MNRDIMVTNAMLAAYLQMEDKDYLGLIEPFVLYLLPNVGEKIKVSQITKKLREEFGFSSIIDNVVTKILMRISRDKKYIEKDRSSFRVVTEYNKKEFVSKQVEIKREIQNVVNELKLFLEEKKYGKHIDEANVYSALINFLSQYNYLCDNIEKIVDISEEKNDSFWVAKFIIYAKEEKPGVYSSFFEIVKGSLASRAIELYAREETSENDIKLNDTKFFFDTRLLISALGLARDEENKATAELMELITNHGGKIATFGYYVKELHGILTKYIRDKNARSELSLDYFNKIHANSIIVQQYADGIEDKLDKINVEIIVDIDRAKAIENNDWPVSLDDLSKCLKEYVRYDLTDQRGMEALDTDATAIESISMLRYGVMGKQTVENCKAILVTQNKNLTYAVHQYFKKQRERKGISLAVSEVDLSALLWLRYCKNESSLPEWRLLENAYAACYPNKQVIDEFNNCLEALNAIGEVDEKQLFLVKSNKINLETLVDKTDNNPNNVTEDKVKELLCEAEDLYRKELDKEYLEKQEYIDIEKQALDEQRRKFKRDQDRKEKEIITKERYLDKERQQIKEEKNRLKTVEQSQKLEAHKKADEEASHKRVSVERFLKILIGILLCIVVGLLSYGAYLSYINQGNIISRCAMIFFTIIGLVGEIDIINNKVNITFSPIIKKIGARIYEDKYSEAYNNYLSVIETGE